MSFPLTNILMARAKSSPVIVSNADVDYYFINRVIVQPPQISGSSEYLTGVNQQPDLGTYADNINDLTETQITNLAAGNDYTGTGENIPWSTLEKVWILENLKTSSVNSTLRYGFIFVYTAIADTIKVLNSGALGVTSYESINNAGGPNTTDWDDNTTPGLGDDFTLAGNYTASITTGNGFTGNAQRLSKTAASASAQLLSTYFTLNSGTYKLRLRHRCSDTLVFVFQLNGVSFSPSTNTGDAIVEVSSDFDWGGGSFRIDLICFNTSNVDYIEIDELEIIKAATDWINPVSGIADNWTQFSPSTTTVEIVSGSGFLGNAQSIKAINATSPRINSDILTLDTAKTYVLSVQYRSIQVVGNAVIILRSIAGGGDLHLFATIPNNSGDAVIFQSEEFTPLSTNCTVEVYPNDSGQTANNEIQIDEIEILEI